MNLIGFIVDVAYDVLDISKDIIDPTPEVIGGEKAEHIAGIAKLKDSLLLLFNITKVVSAIRA